MVCPGCDLDVQRNNYIGRKGGFFNNRSYEFDYNADTSSAWLSCSDRFIQAITSARSYPKVVYSSESKRSVWEEDRDRMPSGACKPVRERSKGHA